VKKQQTSAPAAETPDTPSPHSVGERILTTATDLFYREGVRAVGIQKVIEEAGIAKASLYAHYESKDDLVAACMGKQIDECRAMLEQRLAAPGHDARSKLLAMFDLRAEMISAPNFRGCMVLNAASELTDSHHPARKVTAEARNWLRALMTQLCEEAGVSEAEELAGALVVLYDGAAATAQADGMPAPAVHARWAAEQLIDAHLAAPRRPARPRRRGLPNPLK
jgi:AcrR family transcriptional regulator